MHVQVLSVRNVFVFLYFVLFHFFFLAFGQLLEFYGRLKPLKL